jgi:hypothetical protein
MKELIFQDMKKSQSKVPSKKILKLKESTNDNFAIYIQNQQQR